MTLLGTVSIVTGLLLLIVPETRNKPLMLKMEDLFSGKFMLFFLHVFINNTI